MLYISSFLGFRGKIDRQGYWIRIGASIVALGLLYHWRFQFGGNPALGIGISLLMVVFYVALVSAVVRRLHDIGTNGWFAILVLIFSPIGAVVLGCLKTRSE